MKKFSFHSFAAASMACMLLLSSCSTRILDFTVISSKNVSLKVNKMAGKRVKGKDFGLFGLGVHVKDAVDKAIEQGGDADMLVDGVIRGLWLPFFPGYIVEGTAVNSATLKAEMGEAEFEKWCQEHKAVKLNQN